MSTAQRRFAVSAFLICGCFTLLLSGSVLAANRQHRGSGDRTRKQHRHRRKGKARHAHKARVGKLLLTEADNVAICRTALFEGHMLRRYSSPISVENETGAGPHLLPGGIYLLGCSPQITGPPDMLVAYSVFQHRIRWRMRIDHAASYGTTSRHLFKFFSRVTPAQGLQGRIVQRFVAAYSISTGKLAWRSVYPALGYSNVDTHSLLPPVEGPSGTAGSPEQVVFSFLGTSAYDAQTGALLWTTPTGFYSEAGGGYVGSNTVVIFGREENDPREVTGVDPMTEAIRWNLYLPVSCLAERSEVVGSVEWELGDNCVNAYDLVTGQPVISEQVPSSWAHVAISRNGVVEWGGRQLAYYSLTDLSTPVWSEPAGEAYPQVVGAKEALLENQAGSFIVNLSNGKIRAKVPPEWTTEEPSDTAEQALEGPVEGLIAVPHYGYSSVLELERH